MIFIFRENLLSDNIRDVLLLYSIDAKKNFANQSENFDFFVTPLSNFNQYDFRRIPIRKGVGCAFYSMQKKKIFLFGPIFQK